MIVEFVALWELQYNVLKHANTNHFNNFYDCFYIVIMKISEQKKKKKKKKNNNNNNKREKKKE